MTEAVVAEESSLSQLIVTQTSAHPLPPKIGKAKKKKGRAKRMKEKSGVFTTALDLSYSLWVQAQLFAPVHQVNWMWCHVMATHFYIFFFLSYQDTFLRGSAQFVTGSLCLYL